MTFYRERFAKAAWRTIGAVLMAFPLTGCSKEPELMLASKCGKAGVVLEDALLKRAGLLRSAELGKAARLSERDIMVLNEELNNQLGHASMEQYFRTARKWRDSEYCQKAVGQLKAEIAATVAPLLTPVAPDAQGNVSCEGFIDRASALADPALEDYRKDLQVSVQKTVETAVSVTLKDFQAQALAERMKSRTLIDDLRQSCRAKSPTLNAALMRLDEVRTAKSSTTKDLIATLARLPQQFDCGPYRSLFCESRLQTEAVQAVIPLSEKCDATPKGTPDCPIESQALIQQHLRSFKVRELQKHREKVLTAIQDRRPLDLSVNSSTQASAAYESCKREAINKGLRGDAYDQFKNNECEARAKAARLQPLQERLQLVEGLLSQLR